MFIHLTQMWRLYFYNCLQIRSLSIRFLWQSTPVLLPGQSHGRRSLVDCSPWGRKDRTRLSDFTFTFHFHALEEEMATHPSILAWRIPGMGAWWAAVYGVAQSWTQLTWLSSSNNINQRLEISREATTIRSPFIAMKSSPCLPQIVKACMQPQRPKTTKN